MRTNCDAAQGRAVDIFFHRSVVVVTDRSVWYWSKSTSSVKAGDLATWCDLVLLVGGIYCLHVWVLMLSRDGIQGRRIIRRLTASDVFS